MFHDCRGSNAMLTHVCNVLLSDFAEKSGFESCVWFAQSIEREARTFDNVKSMGF